MDAGNRFERQTGKGRGRMRLARSFFALGYRALRRVYRSTGFSPLPVIAMGFAGLILLGSALLALPVASATGRGVPWFDALFTATSAVCVTGLVVVDTGTAYSTFGHVVLLILIQLGGLGFMTFATLLFRLMGRSISLRERMIMQDSLNANEMGGIVALVRWVALSAFSVELAGAVAFSFRFVPLYGWGKGLFFALFHAVSAFCNAGFDLFGGGRSLTGFSGDVLVNITAVAMVVIGGMGFGTLADIIRKKRFKKFALHTKLALISYGVLLLAGFLLNLAIEWTNPETLGPLSVGDKLMAALFQSVTLRTAGFNTISQQGLRDCTKLVNGFFMFVGAAPASTGGGIKVTTLAILALSVRMVLRGQKNIAVFGRQVDPALVQRALAVFATAFIIAIVDICALSLLQQGFDFLDLYYECFSAIGTVGISAIGSSNLVPAARVLIILTMFAGRVGPLSLGLLLTRRQKHAKELINYPEEHILIG